MSNQATSTPEWEIERGNFAECYLLYLRKSTDDADNQRNSIAYQRAETIRFASSQRLPLAALTLPGFCTDGVVVERHSGFKESFDIEVGSDNTVRYRVGRAKFHRLVGFLAARRFKGVIFLCWDRASRNKADDTILRKLIGAGIDVHFAQAKYEQTSSGELHMDIDGMFAQHHSRVTREKVALSVRRLRGEGFCTYKAPIGYLNTGTLYKNIDTERAGLIREMYRLVDEERYTLSDVRTWAIAHGLTTAPTRRRRSRAEILSDESDEPLFAPKVSYLPTPSVIHRILTNPFYSGLTRGNDRVWVKSKSHEALISSERFARVQAALAGRRVSLHHERKLKLPYRGLLRCRCGRAFSPYVQKGITYYGAKCMPGCDNWPKSVNRAYVEVVLGQLIGRLALSEDELRQMEESFVGQDDTPPKVTDDRKLRRSKLDADLAYLCTHKVTLLRAGAYSPDELASEEARLRSELVDLEAPIDGAALIDAARSFSELIKSAKVSYEIADIGQKERIARTVFSELLLSQDMAQPRLHSGFAAFEGRLLSQCAQGGQVSELLKAATDIKAATAQLRDVLHGSTPEDSPLRP